jgi:c(7)-type cytochrome triheme protein
MISCLLVHLSRNPQGIAVGKEISVSGETLDVGRGAACKIHLQEHLVHLHHALIKRSEDGTLYIDCEKNVEINVNGAMVQSAALDVGTRIEIGPYALAVLPKPDRHDIALSVELMPAHLGELEALKEKQRNTPLTIAALGISKRRLSLALVAAILLLFVFLPLLPAISPGLDRGQQANLPVALNESWSPGALAGGHQVFGNKCGVCHQKPFRAVGDAVCSACHQNIASHGKQPTAHGKKHCATCHSDHKGKQGLAAHDSSNCVACHANLKKNQADTRLADAVDFEIDHPAFRFASPQEQTGIKYSHKVHLAEDGIYSLQGDKVLACQDCHHLEESGRRFAPIQMKRDCEKSCHELEFSDPMQGRVAHGSIDAVTSRVREFYLARMLGKSLPSNACGQVKGESKTECASRLSNNLLADSLFRGNLECGECHEISGGKTLDSWQFAPLKLYRDRDRKSVFSHAKHRTTRCESCHDKRESQSSADVSMPKIEKCRECHSGKRVVKNKVSTRCDQCHVFHGDIKP